MASGAPRAGATAQPRTASPIRKFYIKRLYHKGEPRRDGCGWDICYSWNRLFVAGFVARVAYLTACVNGGQSVTGISMRFTPLALRYIASAYRPTHIASLRDARVPPSLPLIIAGGGRIKIQRGFPVGEAPLLLGGGIGFLCYAEVFADGVDFGFCPIIFSIVVGSAIEGVVHFDVEFDFGFCAGGAD